MPQKVQNIWMVRTKRSSLNRGSSLLCIQNEDYKMGIQWNLQDKNFSK